MTSLTRLLRSAARASLLFLAALPLASAQRPASRIAGAISDADRALLPGSRHPLSLPADDTGAVDPSTPLTGITLHFSRTPAQQAALDQLLAAQQNPASPLFHQFLTPQQFGNTFGMSDADLAKATAWLQSQGFTVTSVAPSRNVLTFAGTASQVEAAFGSPIHNFTRNGRTHFAPVADLSLPSALVGVTRAVDNLSSYRPHAQSRPTSVAAAAIGPTAHFTSSQSGSHFLTPGDVSIIYDIKPAYNAGYTGSGQTIAVLGQSAIALSDIEHFQSASGIAVHDPTIILIPNSGTSAIFTQDESESDLDLEYASSIAPGATIKFVYSGSNQNSSVTDALTYAITNNVAPILSMSYGQCEATLSAGSYTAENALLQQAAVQGQSIVVATGDNGSSDCAENNMSGLYVDYPASSQYVTGMGGTEFANNAAAAGNNTYFQPTSGSDIVTSALSYIPETTWNDSNTSGISAGGGGISTLSPHPSWQTGVPGIPSSSYRLVPDVALSASSNTSNAPYLYCTSDTSVGVAGSCSNGFRDSSNTNLTAVGGTSVGTPIFAGMLALINQAKGATSGQGLVNPTLYTLAANGATYATAFHDITSGNNACVAGYIYCSPGAATSYNAGVGYDLATGLGSVDLYNLLSAWIAPPSSSTLLASTTTITPANTLPAIGAVDVLTITVASGTSASTTTPTGTLSIVIDGVNVGSPTLSAAGTATYTYTPTTSGSHTVTAVFSGNSLYAASVGTITFTVPSNNFAGSTFSLAAPSISVAAGQTGTSTVTVTPAGNYTGTVGWSLATTGNLSNACYTITNVAVTSTAAVSTSLTIGTGASTCNTLSTLASRTPSAHFHTLGSAGTASLHPTAPAGSNTGLIAFALTGAFGLAGLGSRRLRPLAALLVIASATLGASGCGSGSSTLANSSNAPTGTYTLTLTGTDTVHTTITASTNLTLTIH